eukprot:CAMPEP_0201113584 /NCGR_PEP_ID=MMETSP0812-20130820/77925_1 /ASSEMBLY_ACC=CAM_ASM_000668 /TAXON_ID=98059 /ORGANISM="Dinobryon sp., Strain UTEXLB2267" /LENGTH=916 /DNA_ID=CAMNT_0047377135 /DNA_START=265 /DNA_END=3015 /DNA_ORIENTATION=-
MLSDVAKSIGFAAAVSNVLPLLEPLSQDLEPVVRQHLVEQLKALAKFLVEHGEEGYQLVIRRLLPLIASLLEDERSEVRQSASMTLVEVASVVKQEDIGQHVLTIVLHLAHEDEREELRMTASQLLNLLAEALGQDLVKQFAIPEVVSLAEDPMFRVRKATALNFHCVCKVGGEHELLERLMPAFVRLSKDDMYRVRRACAESLCDISRCVGEDIRLGVLVEIFLRLTQDPSKLVKQSVLQQSGMFLSTLPSRAISETLLGHYCSMINNPTGDVSVDAELKHICAFSFPAVLQIVGKNRWKEVREVYHSLAQSRSVNIKQTLAHSLHEVARLLQDQQKVEEELVPVFEDLIQDVEVVQMGVMKHLSAFLSLLSQPCRLSYLPLLHDILHSTNPFNWRLRQSLAVQLPQLIALPPEVDLYRTLFPLVMVLLQDPVASVRRDSFKGVARLILTMHGYMTHNKAAFLAADPPSDPPPSSSSGEVSHEQLAVYHEQCLDEVARSINAFINADKYQLRQLWVELAHQLLLYLPRFLFEKYFVHGLLALTCDHVINVRVPLAVLLSGFHDFRNNINSNTNSNNNSDSNGANTDASTGIITAVEVDSSSQLPVHGLLALTCDHVINVRVPLAVLLSGFHDFRNNNSNTNNTNNSSSDLNGANADASTGINTAAEVDSSSQLPLQPDPWEWLLSRPDICTCVDRLSQDDQDVFIHMQRLQALPVFAHVAFASKSCRGRKVPPGGLSPIAFSHSTDTHPASNLTLIPPLSVPQLPESMRAVGGGEHVIVCESSLLLEEMLLDDTPPPHSSQSTRPRLGSGSTGTAGSAINGHGVFEEQVYAGGVLDGYDDEDDEDDDDDEEVERGFVQVGVVPPVDGDDEELLKSFENTALHNSHESEADREAAFVHISRYPTATDTSSNPAPLL